MCRSVPDGDRLNIGPTLGDSRPSTLHLYQRRHVLTAKEPVSNHRLRLRWHVYFSIRYDRWCKLCELAERISRPVHIAVVKFLSNVRRKKGAERPGSNPAALRRFRSGRPNDSGLGVGAIGGQCRPPVHSWFLLADSRRRCDEALVNEIVGVQDVIAIPNVQYAIIFARPERRSECLSAILLSTTVGSLETL